MRRSADQTRDLLLQTAVQLLHEKGTAAGGGHIRLADLVERARLTTGAAYRLWVDPRWRQRPSLGRQRSAPTC